ncbi:MAG: histidinol-phosphatase [Beijerinckiaceae bacterium]|nr:histidinol-phosphatase [Beijerinckiaceae bacterium]MBX9757526.1 histidinol-phosphatase [Beijerinckiaceae bacterium]MDO9441585.1 histidinol-phosphatase [Beijerinckiaceae bacterium]
MTAVDFARFVEDLATASGEAILPFFRTQMGADDKSGGGVFDPVTEADRAAESIMRRMIEQSFPEHGIIGEEFGDKNPSSEYVWVLDPIDGTKSFISGMPVWGTLIGLQHNGRPCYGMMHQPFTRERFSGDSKSALWRGLDRLGKPVERRLHARACADLSSATLMTTHPALLAPGTLDAYRRVEEKVRLSRYGGDCYAYSMIAAGHVDLVIESGLKPYDIVALVPIVEGSGGIVTNWSGGSPADGGAIIAAGDRRVHAQALKLLESA